MKAEKVNGKWVRVVRRKVIATPIAALQLSEDMERCLQALFAVERIAPESINKDRHKGWDDRNSVVFALKAWHNFARNKLRDEYLRS